MECCAGIIGSMVLRILQYTLCLVSVLPSFSVAFSAPAAAVSRIHGLRRAFNLRAMNASPDDEPARAIRILALHGKGNTGPSFQKALEPLIAALNDRVSSDDICFDWDFPTAPYSLGEAESAGRAWWQLPSGERSFTATTYIGYNKSASLIENKICSEDFDLVFGHSQGAILLAALLATDRLVSQKPAAFIFNGAAVPNPYKDELVNAQLSPEVIKESEALFVVGRNDQINPPEGAELVRDCLDKGGMRVKTISHPNGHSVPVRDQKALNSVVDWIIDTVVSKRAKVEETRL